MCSGKDRTYYVCTETLQEATEWVEALRKNVAALPGGDDGSSSDMSEPPTHRNSVEESEGGLLSGSCKCSSDCGSSSDVRSVDSINSSGGWSEGMSPKLRPSGGSSSTITLTSEAGVLQDEIDVIKQAHPFIGNDILAWRLLRNISYSLFPFKQPPQQRDAILKATSLWMLDTDTPITTTETSSSSSTPPSTTMTANSPTASPINKAIHATSPTTSPSISPLSTTSTTIPNSDSASSKGPSDEVEICLIGPAADLLQGVNELFKKEGIPSMDVDRFAHAYELLVPRSLCIWARLSGRGSECGWRISNTVSGGFIGAMGCLADPSSATTEPILRWFEDHKLVDVSFAGRSTREAPRRTEVCVTLPGDSLDERIAVAVDGVTRFAPKMKKKMKKKGDVKGEENGENVKGGQDVWDEIKSVGSLDAPVYFIVEFSCIKVVRVSVAVENRVNKAEYVMYRWCECCCGDDYGDGDDGDGGCVKPIKIRCKKITLRK